MRRSPFILGDRKAHRSPRRNRWRRVRNFAILGAALAYVILATASLDRKTSLSQVRLDFARIENAVRLFREDLGRCPHDIEELLEERDDPSYLTNVNDPWGRNYRIVCPAPLDPGGVEVLSRGDDGKIWALSNLR